VNVYIYGHVFGTGGIDEVASMLNDAVKGRDVRLIATQVKSPTRAIR
jgi:dTDP-4-dehydrorhamnose reductase